LGVNDKGGYLRVSEDEEDNFLLDGDMGDEAQELEGVL